MTITLITIITSLFSLVIGFLLGRWHARWKRNQLNKSRRTHVLPHERKPVRNGFNSLAFLLLLVIGLSTQVKGAATYDDINAAKMDMQQKAYETASWTLDKFKEGGEALSKASSSVPGDVSEFTRKAVSNYVLFNVLKPFIWVSLLVVISYVFILVVRVAFGKDKGCNDYRLWVTWTSFVCLLASVIMIFCHAGDAMKAAIAPEVFVLEKIKNELYPSKD